MLFELDLHGFLKLIGLSASGIFCEVHVEIETKKGESRWRLRRKKASVAPKKKK